MEVLGVTVVCDSDLVLGAGDSVSALVSVIGWVSGVIYHQEPSLMPLRGILVDLSPGEVVHVGVDVNVEDTVVGELVDFWQLRLEVIGPAGPAVRPWSTVLFSSPRVSALE